MAQYTSTQRGRRATRQTPHYKPMGNGTTETEKADGEGGDGSEVQPMLDIGIFRPYDDTLGVAVALRSQADGLKLVK